MEEIVIDKNLLLDNTGRPLTQSLFLEIGYSPASVFTLKEDHYMYNGKLMYSLKKLFIELGDPTEYEFSKLYLLGWKQWKRMNENKVLRKHFDEWREELEYAMRCKGVKAIIAAADSGSFQSAKFLVDRGWDKRQAGRPSKEEIEREKKFNARVAEDYSADVVRLYGEP